MVVNTFFFETISDFHHTHLQKNIIFVILYILFRVLLKKHPIRIVPGAMKLILLICEILTIFESFEIKTVIYM